MNTLSLLLFFKDVDNIGFLLRKNKNKTKKKVGHDYLKTKKNKSVALIENQKQANSSIRLT